MKKYEITDIQHPTYTHLHRIRALKDIPRYGVKAGDLGGYIESENNLSQEGDCWVFDNANVCGRARVFGDAWVFYNLTANMKVETEFWKQSMTYKEWDDMSWDEMKKINVKEWIC